jgi:hypothetical protein
MTRRRFIKCAATGLLIPDKRVFASLGLTLHDAPFVSQFKSQASAGCPSEYTAMLEYEWPLSSLTLVDSTGNSSGGTFTGSPTLTSGQIGQAVNFNGTSQYGTTGAALLGYSLGTITWWQNPSGAYNAGTQRFIWGQKNGGNEFSAQLFSNDQWYVGWNTSTDERVNFAASGTTWIANTWSFYAFTWSTTANQSVLYMAQSGVITQIGVNNNTPAVVNVGADLVVASSSSLTGFFPGALNDLKFFTTVLSTATLQSIYNNGVQGCP